MDKKGTMFEGLTEEEIKEMANGLPASYIETTED